MHRSFINRETSSTTVVRRAMGRNAPNQTIQSPSPNGCRSHTNHRTRLPFAVSRPHSPKAVAWPNLGVRDSRPPPTRLGGVRASSWRQRARSVDPDPLQAADVGMGRATGFAAPPRSLAGAAGQLVARAGWKLAPSCCCFRFSLSHPSARPRLIDRARSAPWPFHHALIERSITPPQFTPGQTAPRMRPLLPLS